MRAFLLNCASVPGTTMTVCAKMIGMTPAVLMRSGMKFFALSRLRPRAIVRCGIWIGTRRAATVIATVPATTSTITTPSTTSSESRSSRLDVGERLPDARPDALDDREEDQQRRAVADAALGDLLAQPHHEHRARREEEHHLQAEPHARMRHRAGQRLREQRVPLRLQHGDAPP